MLVEVAGATFGYDKRPVVRVESLAMYAGRCLGIFGPNGAGKTTLVRGIVGLLPPMQGSVRRNGGERAIRFGYLPQHRAMELHWPMTGFDAAAMAVSALRTLGRVNREDSARVTRSMELLEVESLRRRPFAKLSGGQQQRLLLAGALAAEPNILILDEPTDGLDVRSGQALLDVLRAQNAAGLCTVMISHDVEDLLSVADEVAWLHAPTEWGESSWVEVITPDELRQRVLKVERPR